MELYFQISDAAVKLDLKKKDIEQLLETDSLLWKEFKEAVSDSRFTEYLTKVYKKKVRRSKKKAASGPGMHGVHKFIPICSCTIESVFFPTGVLKNLRVLQTSASGIKGSARPRLASNKMKLHPNIAWS